MSINENRNQIMLSIYRLLGMLIILLGLHDVVLQLKGLFYRDLYLEFENLLIPHISASTGLLSVIASHGFITMCLGMLLFVQAAKFVQHRWIQSLEGTVATQTNDIFIFVLGAKVILIYGLIEYFAYIVLHIISALLRLWLPDFSEIPIVAGAIILDAVVFLLLAGLFFYLLAREKKYGNMRESKTTP